MLNQLLDIDPGQLNEHQLRHIIQQIQADPEVIEKNEMRRTMQAQRVLFQQYQGRAIKDLTDAEKIHYAHLVKQSQQGVDWNAMLRKRHRPPVRTKERIIERPAPVNGNPYDSHLEVRLFEGQGPFAHLPKGRAILEYVSQHRYTSDGFIPYTTILLDAKGALENKEECSKFVKLHEQYGVAFLFIFSQPGIELAWNPPRKDGTVITQEQWVAYHRIKRRRPFYCCFEDTAQQFIRSLEFQDMVARHQTNDYAPGLIKFAA